MKHQKGNNWSKQVKNISDQNYNSYSDKLDRQAMAKTSSSAFG